MLQTVGASIHKRIIAQQKAAADAILAEETWGEQIRAIEHAEVASGMRQQVPLSKAGGLLDACSAARERDTGAVCGVVRTHRRAILDDGERVLDVQPAARTDGAVVANRDVRQSKRSIRVCVERAAVRARGVLDRV